MILGELFLSTIAVVCKYATSHSLTYHNNRYTAIAIAHLVLIIGARKKLTTLHVGKVL